MLTYLDIFNLLGNTGFLILTAVLLIESIHEQEKRAIRIASIGVIVSLINYSLILKFDILRSPFVFIFGVGVFLGIAFIIPWKQNSKALKGCLGYVKGNVTRFHEAESVFARTRSMPEGSEVYQKFYAEHPDWEEKDRIRRKKGILGRIGSIDTGYQPNVAMMISSDEMPEFLGPFAKSQPSEQTIKADLSPEKATQIVKSYAKHLGADMVGVCEVDQNWIYSHKGEIYNDNWEDWGKEITNIPKYAVVFLLEMDRDNVISAPHTPTAVESTINYAKGPFISTILGRWFTLMGYQGIAQHSRNYDVILPPLAVDAGLGEIGRQGYLIAPRFGARVRVFATLTDMPLKVDEPISIGVEEFCEKCMKCAESCPSKSIPTGKKTICRGVEKWKLDEDSCYDYWSRIGTDCGICMAICPFSRPDSYFHRFIRWFVANSPVAKALFPHIDNFIYGKTWKSRKVADWLEFPKRSEVEDYPEYTRDIKY